MTLEEIKDKLRKRLIEHEGNIEPFHLVDIVAEAKAIGLEEKDIAKLVPDLDQSINWAAIKEEKRIAEETKLLKKQEQLLATELLDAMISYSFSDGVVAQAELDAIFTKATELRQNSLMIARKINKRFEKGDYKPYPAPDLKAKNLKEIILSTSWYDAENYEIISNKQSKQNIASENVKPTISIPKIHVFEVSKTTIKKGESVIISWHVSGVDHLTISGLGRSKLLKGSYSISPAIDTQYVLDAGGVKQSLNIKVQKPSHKIRWIIIVVILLYFISRLVS